MTGAPPADRGTQLREFKTGEGVRVTGERWEGPGPAVVLLHAGVTDHRSWQWVAPIVSRAGFDVIAYDRRGFGYTQTGEKPYTHVGDLVSLLGLVAGDSPAWLVGNSAGGGVAVDAALTAPDRVAGLILLAPSISGAPELQAEDLDAPTRTLAVRLESAMGEERLLAQTHLWLDGPSEREGRVGGRARELALDMGRRILESEVDEQTGGRDFSAWAMLEQVSQPVAVGCGALDVPAIIETCQTLALRFPCSRYQVFEDAAHLLPLDAPERTAAWIVDVISTSRG